jgi:signal transduction histidine kinase
MAETRQLLRSSRFRATAASSLAVVVVLTFGAVVGQALLANDLEDRLDLSIENRAADLAAFVDPSAPPASLSARGDESFVWIGVTDSTAATHSTAATQSTAATESTAVAQRALAATGLQLADQEQLDGVASDGIARGFSLTYDEPGGEIETSEFRVAGVPLSVDPSLSVIVGAERETIDKTIAAARSLLAIGVPLASVLVGIIIWFALGRAFRPVEAIRAEADEISGQSLDRRVPTDGSGDEVDRLATTVNDMLERLSAQDRRQRQFASDASHELKTPVANLRALVETSSPDDWSDLQPRMVDETARMTAIVDDLLLLAISEEGAQPHVRERVHLDDLVFDEAELLRHRTELEIDVASVTPADVLGDSEELRRAVRNLASNASRYAEHRVWFGCTSESGEVRIEVGDDGSGIPAEDQERIFERFGRADASRERNRGGTGLGLAIVREIVEAHGGSVMVDAGQAGTVFVVMLPAID